MDRQGTDSQTVASGPDAKNGTTPVIEVENVTKWFPVSSGLLRRSTAYVRAVDDVSVAVHPGETLGIVGESGCGKTTLARLLLQDLRPTTGTIRFHGQSIDEMSRADRNDLARWIGAVFQDPHSSLNPRHRVGTIITEPARILKQVSRDELQEKRSELLRLVGLPPNAADFYPHEFSGGQRQRIAIARALSVNPRLLVLDEPISALDVSIRAQIINLLKDVQQSFNLAYVFIAHDLSSVYHMADRVAVMYLGEVVETSETIDLYKKPAHPYTSALISASLPISPRARKEEVVVGGEVPSPLNPPPGCRFHPRCPLAFDRCRNEVPEAREVSPGHWSSCFLAEELYAGDEKVSSPAPSPSRS